MSQARTRGLIVSITLLVAGALISGCSSGPAKLTLHPAAGHVAYAQDFNQAYCGKTKDGSYTCVLLSDETPAGGAQKASAGGHPLKPTSQTPLRQVVHINVLWRPVSGTHDTSVANATIDWYVLNNNADGNEDLLVYQGSGYVTLKPDDDTMTVYIHSADLSPALVHGSLSDPIGNATLSGKFVAINDNDRTTDLVNATRQRTAAIASSR